MRYDIRELNLSGILDQAVALVKDNLGTFLTIMVVVWLPVQLLNVGAQLALLPEVSMMPTPEEAQQIFAAQTLSLLANRQAEVWPPFHRKGWHNLAVARKKLTSFSTATKCTMSIWKLKQATWTRLVADTS